jgi:hypothetical protein
LPCIEADVTNPDGTTTHFAARADLSTDSSGFATLIASTRAPATYFGLSISWHPANVTTHTSYAPDIGGGDVNLWVLHGDEQGNDVLSSTSGGSVVFDRVGAAASPGDVSGTFDAIAMYGSPQYVLHSGKFRGSAQAP